jgi:hypothetical protein
VRAVELVAARTDATVCRSAVPATATATAESCRGIAGATARVANSAAGPVAPIAACAAVAGCAVATAARGAVSIATAATRACSGLIIRAAAITAHPVGSGAAAAPGTRPRIETTDRSTVAARELCWADAAGRCAAGAAGIVVACAAAGGADETRIEAGPVEPGVAACNAGKATSADLERDRIASGQPKIRDFGIPPSATTRTGIGNVGRLATAAGPDSLDAVVSRVPVGRHRPRRAGDNKYLDHEPAPRLLNGHDRIDFTGE